MKFKTLVKANKLALGYYEKSFRITPAAREYVYRRVSRETATKFKIGYAPKSGLLDFLSDNGIGLKTAEKLGLAWRDNESGEYKEFFTKRIMIPIIHAGMVVGFGGRATSKYQKSKYVNSKSSPLYNKSDVLYGLWHTRSSIKKSNLVIVLEGYFDLLALYDSEIENIVAVCGTALTDNHVLMLRRYTNTVGVLTDGDSAGRKAAKKMAKLFSKHGLHNFITKLPDELDPEEFLKTYNRSKLIKLIKKSAA